MAPYQIHETLSYLTSLVSKPELTEVVEGWQAAEAFVVRILEQYDQIEVDIDGVVVKVNDFGGKLRLVSWRALRGGRLLESFLLKRRSPHSLVWTRVGRTGVITPVARLQQFRRGCDG